MKTTRANDMPFGTCPECEHEWQIDDWYEFENDDTVECPKCQAVITLADKDVTTTFTFTA